MIESTLNYLDFMKNDFIFLARVFPEYLLKCDQKGIFDGSKHLKHHQKFFKDKPMIKDIISCKEGILLNIGLDSCLPICKRFSPLKFNKDLEGGLEQMRYYKHALEGLIKKRKEKS